ncbi:hypothetical protein B0H11DRAFT_2104162 [Mycena galericulata]|nr:hypothetical protein B0H11DRAFT_2104162 [Mycena galericulata]
MGGGAWTRWTAVGPEEHARNLTSGEVALLRHPYFPEHILWTRERTFSWYSLGSINNLRREARNKKLFIANEDAEAAAKILDAEGKHSKKRRADDKEEPRKKARVRAAAVKSEEIVAPSGAFAGAQEGPAQAEWDALYAKPRTSTRATKQIQDQTAIIARLEAENEALRTKLANEKQLAVQRMPLSLHPEFLGFMRETLACEVMLTCNAREYFLVFFCEAETRSLQNESKQRSRPFMVRPILLLPRRGLHSTEGQVSTLTAALKKAKAEYAAEINRSALSRLP